MDDEKPATTWKSLMLRGLASDVYLYHLKAENLSRTMKMVVLR